MSLLTLAEVITRTRKSKSAIYRDMLAGEFPQARKDGKRTVWLAADLEAWEQSLPKMGRSMGFGDQKQKKPLKSAA